MENEHIQFEIGTNSRIENFHFRKENLLYRGDKFKNSNKIDQLSVNKIPNSNKIHLNKENVRVIVRIRPNQGNNESNINCVEVLENNVSGKKQIILKDPRHRGLPKRYEFDEVYGMRATTERIYTEEIYEFVPPLLSECSCINVFAFGSSGTGKTFTMHGDTDHEMGLVGLTVKQLIEINNRRNEPGKFSFSFFEIYCEKVNDLLSGLDSSTNSNSSNKQVLSKVSIRTDICGRVRVVGNKSFEFSTWEEFNYVYSSALRKRTSAKTSINLTSSRSHACIQINFIPPSFINSSDKVDFGDDDTIENRRRRGSISFHVKPKITNNYPRTIVNLIDLSGFENNKLSNNMGKRMIESTFINSSLLSLSKVINALKNSKGKNSTQSCIPYRESKLTRLLQEFLGGGADPPYSPYCLRCIMICTISPSVTFFQQTYATLNTPSHGVRSILKKYIGIADTNMGTNNKELQGASIDSRTANNPSRSSNKLESRDYKDNLHSKFSISAIDAKCSAKNHKVICNYDKVESRVAQIIRGKTNSSSNMRSLKFARVGSSIKAATPGSCTSKKNTSVSIGLNTIHGNTRMQSQRSSIRKPSTNGYKADTENITIDKTSLLSDQAQVDELSISLEKMISGDSGSINSSCFTSSGQFRISDQDTENTSARVNASNADHITENEVLEEGEHNSDTYSGRLKQKKAPANRPVTRSQTRKKSDR
ncbi:kinesin heavy chain [Cryptosporidium felis]|nr:kinesin heavy chain [Cryptosporidium felis]